MENRLKEWHEGLALDRTSGSRFWANQFRVLLTAAAYVLLQELRRRAHGTACATAQVSTLRERLLKWAVWVERSVRRPWCCTSTTAPWGATLAPGGPGRRGYTRLTRHETVAPPESSRKECRGVPESAACRCRSRIVAP